MIDCGRTFVADKCELDPLDPITDAEIVKTAKSAWRIQAEGRNWAGNGRMIYVAFPAERMPVFCRHPRWPGVLTRWTALQDLNWWRREFTAVPDWLADHQIIPRWSARQYQRILDAMVELGIIEITHRGGRGPRDPRRYKFRL